MTRRLALSRIALFAIAACLATSCTAAEVASERAERPTSAAAANEESQPAEQQPESTQPESGFDLDSELIVYATNEDVFALDPTDGSALLLGRRDAAPAIRSVAATEVANGSLYWIIEATPASVFSSHPIDGSAVIRTDLRTGESVRLVELGELETGSDRRGYRLETVTDDEVLVAFIGATAGLDDPVDYYRFDALTGAPIGSFASSVLDSVGCTHGVERLQALPDGSILAQSSGALGVLDPANASVEPLLACDDWPTYGDHLSADDLRATVVEENLADGLGLDTIAAVPLDPIGVTIPVVMAQGDLWWIAGGAVATPDDPTKQASLRALVRFDLQTGSVAAVWPLGHIGGSAQQLPVTGLSVIQDNVVVHRPLDGQNGHLALLDESGQGWTIVPPADVADTYISQPVVIQPGSDHLLITRGESLSLARLDIDAMRLDPEVPVVDLAVVAASLPAPVPGVDPQRIFPGIRDLGPDETLLFVPSNAMAPTVTDGDAIIVDTTLEPQVGDLVTFSKPQGTGGENDLLKRIVAAGGQTVSFVDDQLYIDGIPVDEDYLAEPNSTRPRLQIPGCIDNPAKTDRCELPPNTFFTLGDNRLGSSDSRVYGPIDADTVVGVVVEIVRP